LRQSQLGLLLVLSLGLAGCAPSAAPELDARARLLARWQGVGPVELEVVGTRREAPCQPTGAGYCRQAEILRGLPADLAAERGGEPSDLAARGLRLLLVARDARGLGAGITLLRRAVAGAPQNATFQHDLALALWLRYRQQRGAEDLLEALELTEQALRLDPGDLAALVNRARLFQDLGTLHATRRAWLLALDAGLEGPAAEEGVAFLELRGSLTEPERIATERFAAALPSGPAAAVSEAPQAARRWLADAGWPRWADRVEAEDGLGAERVLGEVRDVAEALAAATGDPSEAEAVRQVRDLGPARWPSLAASYRNFAAGVRLYFERRNGLAAEALERFLAYPEPLISVWRRWARYYLAVIRAHERGSAGALELERLAQEAGVSNHGFLTGRVNWSQGLAASERADFSLARQHYEAARSALAAAGMPGEAAYLEILLADLDAREGLGRRAVERAIRALPELRRWGTAARLSSALGAAAERAAQLGWSVGSVALADEAVEWSLLAPRPSVRVDAHLARAQVRSRAGGATGAAADLVAAGRALVAISDPTIRQREEVAWLAAHGALGFAGHGRERRAQLGRALQYQQQQEGEVLALDLLVARADLALADGDLAAAQADLSAARVELARWRRRDRALFEEQAFLERAERILEREMMLALRELGGEDRAFALAREAQASSRGSLRPQGEPLPPGVVRLRSYSLPEELLVRCESATDARVLRTAIRREELLAHVSGLGRELQARDRPSAAARASLANLYEALIGPCEPWLAAARELVLVPDGRLGAIPFGALFDERAGRFLVESYALREEPPVAGLGSLETASHRPRTFLGVAVGTVSADALELAKLSALPAVATEVAEVGAQYPEPRFLREEEATAAEVLARLPEAEVFHFGGHGLPATAERPSALVVAGRPALLEAEALRRLDLSRLQLVVLGACGSPGQGRGAGGRLLDLASPFLDAGAHAVVLATTQVYDQQARPLLTAFHARFAAGATPAEALRAAQLEILRASEDPFASLPSWAPWSVVASP
jgi:CHAT domain-containing protein